MPIIETKYFYYREPRSLKRPELPGAARVTLCRVQDDQHRFGLGWAICTEPTPHHKNLVQVLAHEFHEIPGTTIRIRGGRSIARGRAEAALRDHDRQGARGKLCDTGSATELYRYDRPIHHAAALEVIHKCNAQSLLMFLDTSNIVWLPVDFQNLDAPVFRKRIHPVARAFGDAVELQRMETLAKRTPEVVYSEELEIFIEEPEG